MVRISEVSVFARYRRWRAQQAEERRAFEQRKGARSLLRTLVEARNEPDPDERRKLLEKCLSPSVVMVDDGPAVIGLESLMERFGRDHDDQQFVVEITGRVGARADEVWTQWEVSGLRKELVAQTVTARIDHSTGRISRVAVTEAREPPTPSVLRRMVDAIAANPLAGVGVIGGATYFALRLPTQFFYARLGTTPDEVGLGPQVLVPQSLFLLVLLGVVTALLYPLRTSRLMLSVRAIGRLWQDKRRRAAFVTAVVELGTFAAIMVVGVWLIGATSSVGSGPDAEVPPPEWTTVALFLLFLGLGLTAGPLAGQLVPAAGDARRQLAAERRRRRDRRERRGAVFSLAGSVVGGTFLVLLAYAIASGAAVREGSDAGGELFPWRALPATVDFKSTAAKPALTNRCGELRLLGVANNQIVLFDTRQDRAVRVAVADASVSTNVGCLWIAVSPQVRSVPDCDSGKCLHEVTLNLDVSDEDADIEGVLSVSECGDTGCAYRRIGAIDQNDLQLAAGRYRVILTATDGERQAEQAAGFTVP